MSSTMRKAAKGNPPTPTTFAGYLLFGVGTPTPAVSWDESAVRPLGKAKSRDRDVNIGNIRPLNRRTLLNAPGSRLARSGLPSRSLLPSVSSRPPARQGPPGPGPTAIGSAGSSAKETLFAKRCKPAQTIANAMLSDDVAREIASGNG